MTPDEVNFEEMLGAARWSAQRVDRERHRFRTLVRGGPSPSNESALRQWTQLEVFHGTRLSKFEQELQRLEGPWNQSTTYALARAEICVRLGSPAAKREPWTTIGLTSCDERVRATAHWIRGWAALVEGNLDLAVADLDAARDLELGSRSEILARTLVTRSVLLSLVGRGLEAMLEIETWLETSRPLPYARALLTLVLAQLHCGRGESHFAKALLRSLDRSALANNLLRFRFEWVTGEIALLEDRKEAALRFSRLASVAKRVGWFGLSIAATYAAAFCHVLHDNARAARNALGRLRKRRPEPLLRMSCRALEMVLLAKDRRRCNEALAALREVVPMEGLQGSQRCLLLGIRALATNHLIAAIENTPLADALRLYVNALRVERRGSEPGGERYIDSGAFSIALERCLGPEQARPSGGICVSKNGSQFIRSEGSVVHLDHRPVLRTLLAALASAPGRGVRVNDLIAAVWAADRSRRSSLQRRLRFAIHTLRRLGLESTLWHRRGWYGLAESVLVSD